MWELEQYPVQRRKEIDPKYEYRRSKLTFVFGTLLHEGRLTEQDQRGVREDKLDAIRSYADFLAKVDVEEDKDLARQACSMEVYAIKVTLLGTRPPVWRRILVDRDMILRNLHRTLQTVMGWENSHLHQFVLPKQGNRNPRYGSGTKIVNESGARVGDVIGTAGERLLYEYDFGDGWQHELLLEEVLLGDESFETDVRGGRTMLSAGRLRRAARIRRDACRATGRQSPKS